MNQRNFVVSLVLVAVVLAGAYGLGLLIRQARLGDREATPPVVAEPNDAIAPERLAPNSRIGRAKPKPTPEQLAAAKQQKAEELATVDNLTEEQRQQRRDALRAQMRTGSRGPGRLPHLSPEELKDISERWPQMSEQERLAYRAAMRRMRPVSPSDANAPTDSAERTAEPNAAGQG